MKKSAVVALMMAVVLTVSIFGGSYLSAFAQNAPATMDIEPTSDGSEPEAADGLSDEAVAVTTQEENEESNAEAEDSTEQSALNASDDGEGAVLDAQSASESEDSSSDGTAQPQEDEATDGELADSEAADDSSSDEVAADEADAATPDAPLAGAAGADIGVLMADTVELEVEAQANNIKLSWTKVTGATRYEILRSSTLSGQYVKVGEIDSYASTIVFVDTFLLENTQYFYKVTAYNGNQVIDTCAPEEETTEDFFNILGLRAAAVSDTSVKLNWILDDDNDYVKIYRAESRQGPWVYVADEDSLTYTDEDLDPGKTYYYGLAAFGFDCNYECLLATGPVQVTTKSATKPGIPQNLEAASIDSQSIRLSWNTGSGIATGYYIYRSTSAAGPYTQVGQSTSTEYTDSGLTNNTTYYYKVAAFNAAGTSEQSSYRAARTKAVALAAPTNVLATTVDEKRIKVSWDAVPGATRYYIYRSETMYGEYEQVATTISTVHTNNWLEPNTTYYYVVVAYSSAAGLGEKSTPVYASTGATLPVAPTGIAADGLDSATIRVAWNTVAGATGYRIYRASSSTGTYIEIGTSPTASYDDEHLTPNTTYYYKVSAYNAAGTGPLSSYKSAQTKLGGPSTAPTNVIATALDSSRIQITWGAVAGAAGYQVYRSNTYNGTYDYVRSVTSTEYTDTGLSASTGYYYKVSAYNAAGNGPQSAYAYARTLAGGPTTAPINLTAVGLDGSRIQLNWTAVVGANGYQVYRSNTYNGVYSYIGSSSSVGYTDTGLNANTGYYYKVAAYDSVGTGPQSAYAYGRTLQGGPTVAPINLTAVGLDGSRIQLNWTAVVGATGYQVYRSNTYNGAYSPIGTATATGYTDTGLTANTGYYYKVAAFNNEGTGPQSAYAYGRTLQGGPTVAPINLTAVGLDGSRIQLNWTAVVGATGYQVYRSNAYNGVYTAIGSSDNTAYTDTGLTSNTGYYYKVAAYNAEGTGPQSGYAYGKTLGGAPTGVPVNLNAVALDASRIHVSWSAVVGANGYYIYRSLTPTGSYSYVGSSTSTNFINTGLDPNTGYYYVVAAYNSEGTGPQSGYTYAKTHAPAITAPSVYATAQTANSILVSWSAVPGASNYILYFSSNQYGTYQSVLVGTSLSFVHSGIPSNTTYYYKVSAIVNGVLGPQGGPASATTKGYSPITQAPLCLSATALDTTRIQLGWNAVVGAKGYYVYCSTSAYGAYSYVGSVSGTSMTHTGLTPNTGYYYKVAAYNEAGAGPQSGYAYAKTSPQVTRPYAPYWVSAYGLDRYRMQVYWNGVAGADGYYVYRATSAKGTYCYVGSSTSTNFVDSGLKRGCKYYYKIVAYNSAGQSPLSPYACGKTTC